MSKRVLVSLASIVLLLALALVLNPSAERHRSRIKDSIAESSPLAEVLGVGALTAFVSHYHSLGLASYTMVGERLLSVGALGMVFVVE